MVSKLSLVNEKLRLTRFIHRLLPNWREMFVREMSAREVLRTTYPNLPESVDHTAREEEEYQCSSCRTLCFLSQVVTADGKETVCVDHISELTSPPALFRLRYSDDEFRLMYTKVKSRSDKAGRLSGPVFGSPVTTEADARMGGRKRKPSAAALAAAGEGAPRSQKVKVEKDDYDSEASEDMSFTTMATERAAPTTRQPEASMWATNSQQEGRRAPVWQDDSNMSKDFVTDRSSHSNGNSQPTSTYAQVPW